MNVTTKKLLWKCRDNQAMNYPRKCSTANTKIRAHSKHTKIPSLFLRSALEVSMLHTHILHVMPLYDGVPYYDPLLTAIFFFANNQSWHSAQPCTWNSTWMNLSQPHCSPASPDDVSSTAAHHSAATHRLCKHPCPTRELQSWKKC